MKRITSFIANNTWLTSNGKLIQTIATCAAAISSSDDSSLTVSVDPTQNEMSFEMGTYFSYGTSDRPDNRVGVTLDATISGSSLLTCEAEHIGSSTSTPNITWIRNGVQVVEDGNYKFTTTPQTGSVRSELDISNFLDTNVGEYQCIFTDTDAEGEIITTVPLRLDTGNQKYCYNSIMYISHIHYRYI